MEFKDCELEGDGDKPTILQVAYGVSRNGEEEDQEFLEEDDEVIGGSKDASVVGSDYTVEKTPPEFGSPQTLVSEMGAEENRILETERNCEIAHSSTESGNLDCDKTFGCDNEHSGHPVNCKMSLGLPKPGDGFSSNDSSCLNSPLLLNFNGITFDSISGSNVNVAVLNKEFETLKGNYQNLQNDYKTSLEREKELCDRLQEHGGQDDESCNSLLNVNNELRKELENVLSELRTLRNENKRLQETLSSKGEDEKRTVDRVEKLEDIVKLEKIVSELEANCKELEEERDNAKEKLAAHDIAAKRAITALQKEMTVRVDQVAKSNQETVKEKDSLLLKIVKLEESSTSQLKKIEALEKKLAESKTECEKLKTIKRQKETDFAKCQGAVSEREQELSKLKEEVTKLKDEESTQNVKVKWAQNKLKQELESHKDTKMKLAQASAKIEEMKEEGEQIRAACQEMIKKYQDSEEMRSVQLDKELKDKNNALRVHEHEIAVQDEIHRKRTQEMEALKAEHRKALSEISQLKTTVSMLEGKLSNYTIKNTEMEKRITVLSKKEEDSVLTDKLLCDASQDLKGYKEQVTYYVELEERLRKQLLDSENEGKECKQREAELLSYTEKLTENNANWKSKAFDFQSRIETMETEMTELRETLKDSHSSQKGHNTALRKQREEFENALEELVTQVEQKRKLVEELTLGLEEAQDEVKVQKRKNTSTIKDLQRQLQQSKKRIDQLEECLSNSQDGLPLKSRASSSTSLDRLSNDSGNQPPAPNQTNGGTANTISNPSLQGFSTYNGEYSIVQPRQRPGEIEVDKAVLVDRICRLQKAHARKNERIEFLEEHNRSLVEDIKKKNKIVQFYATTREESGTLVPNRFDRNKAEMSKKGGIMASVYSSRVSDKDMTLDLSLEINRKLQSVLEDTLLKNITLKESINTLGTEIARLQDDLKKIRQ